MIWKNFEFDREPTPADIAWAEWCNEVRAIQDEWLEKRKQELRDIFNKYKGNEMSGVITTRRPVEPIKKAPKGRYQTRGGLLVTIYATDVRLPLGDAVIGVVHHGAHEEYGSWQADGSWTDKNEEHPSDLVETVRSGHQTKFVTYYLPRPERSEVHQGRVGGVYRDAESAEKGKNLDAIILELQIPTADEIVILES